MVQPSTIYRVGNMDCAHCAKEVETGVIQLDGVITAQVDFATSKMLLVGNVPYATLKERVESLGKTLHTLDEAQPAPSRGGIMGYLVYLAGRFETRLALIGGVLILAGLGVGFISEAGAFVLDTLAVLIAVYPIARSGWRTLRINREFSINLLMTIAAIGAILIGEHLEAAVVIFLFALGEALEGYTADRARDSLRSLLSLKPKEALVRRAEGEIILPVELLRVGDVTIVKPHERIPMDGAVLRGNGGVDQAPITGESIPVYKTTGDAVFAGSINGSSTLEIEVTALAEDNTLSRIIRLVEEAQSQRAPQQRVIERFAHYYTPAVVVLAVFVALLPPLLFNAPFFSTTAEQGWLYRALTMLVIACPCALVISTPVTIISAITAAARRGVLIKGGIHLEALGTIRAAAFDKTGTLTQGKPVISGIHPLQGTAQGMLAYAAAVEQRSTHPLAQAVLQAANRQAVQVPAADHVTVLAGQGVRGTVGAQTITVGSHTFFEAEHPHQAELCKELLAAEAQGQTALLVAVDQAVVGYFTAADALRPTSQQVIAELNALGIETILCTGDNAVVAQAVGKAVGMHEIKASLLPQDKVKAVEVLRTQYQQVMMVGDGVNDTPALAAATLGIAMGGAGSAQAMETADIVLMADDLTQLPYAIRLARLARRLILQNIAISLGVKALFLGLAAVGGASLWLAVFADVGMSLLVTLNGMRPLRLK